MTMIKKTYITDPEKLEELGDKYQELCIWTQNHVAEELMKKAQEIVIAWKSGTFDKLFLGVQWESRCNEAWHTDNPQNYLYPFLLEDEDSYGFIIGLINQVDGGPSDQCDFMEYFLQEILQEEFTTGDQTLTTVVEKHLAAVKARNFIL